MIEDYNLHTNNYLTKMWETRGRFIPVYYKTDFFPFIQTTSRSESLNSRMKSNVGPTYSIISFLKEYDRIIETINRAERLEHTYSNQKRPKEFIFSYTIEQQAAELYNRNIFKKIQIQLKATARLNYREVEQGKEFQVWQKRNQIHQIHRIRTYNVTADLTEGNESLSFICGKFEKDGILCSHILKILIENEVSMIPNKYIIQRWRKKATNASIRREQQETLETSAVLRYNVLSRKSAIINSKGSKHETSMQYLMAKFDKLDLKLDTILQSLQTSEEAHQNQDNQGEQSMAAAKAVEDGQSMAPAQDEEEDSE